MAKQKLQTQDRQSPTRRLLPKGVLKAQSRHFTKRLAEARKAGEHIKVLGFADDPIKEFNTRIFFLSFSAHIEY